MSDEKHPLRDALNRGISIASNPDIPAGEAAKQVFSAARAEFNAASAYTQRRKQRKSKRSQAVTGDTAKMRIEAAGCSRANGNQCRYSVRL